MMDETKKTTSSEEKTSLEDKLTSSSEEKKASLEDKLISSSEEIKIKENDYDPLIGKSIGGCLLKNRIGVGGMGAIYRGHHMVLDKDFAIKIIPPYLANQKETALRFLREARAIARLDHPNIVRVANAGFDQGYLFIAMEFVDGESLDNILDRKGAIPWQEAVVIACEVARGLVKAHEMGIIHRDIKPGNILLSNQGEVKITDFGLNRSMVAQGDSISKKGEILGTPSFMAPEQATGKEIDHRTDLYSLGATLYNLVTGKEPFVGTSTINTILKLIREEPVSPKEIKPNIPDSVVEVIQGLMAKEPEKRYSSSKEVLTILKKLTSSGKRVNLSPERLKAQKSAQAPPPKATPQKNIDKEEQSFKITPIESKRESDESTVELEIVRRKDPSEPEDVQIPSSPSSSGIMFVSDKKEAKPKPLKGSKDLMACSGIYEASKKPSEKVPSGEVRKKVKVDVETSTVPERINKNKDLSASGIYPTSKSPSSSGIKKRRVVSKISKESPMQARISRPPENISKNNPLSSSGIYSAIDDKKKRVKDQSAPTKGEMKKSIPSKRDSAFKPSSAQPKVIKERVKLKTILSNQKERTPSPQGPGSSGIHPIPKQMRRSSSKAEQGASSRSNIVSYMTSWWVILIGIGTIILIVALIIVLFRKS